MTSNRLAKNLKINRISAVWIIPIITLIIGVWMVFAHFADQGVRITLLANDANGIIAGKTVIKSRNVDVGIIESVTLSEDYQQVILKGQIYKNMEPLLKNDSVFWVVKPQIGREGISGLGTLLSGVYIELIPGSEKNHFDDKPFNLSDNPPLAGPNVQGIRINLNSTQSDVIPRGAPVMFRGFTVGYVETSDFDINARQMKYQLFIPKPYDVLVTDNVRFWKEGGINFSLSPRGANLEIPSLEVLLSGGISFDVPTGSKFGIPAQSLATYQLYEDKNAIQDSQYTHYHEFLLFFTDSISGLSVGAPVEYRGIRLGTVSKVPFYTPEMLKSLSVLSYNIPVLIRIEPGRLTEVSKEPIDLTSLIIKEQQVGLRASLKSINFLTGSLYVDLDFYPEVKDDKIDSTKTEFGYDTIATISTGLSQIQLKLIQTLDNFNQLPLNKTVTEFNQSLAEVKQLVNSLNKITSSKEMQNLPQDMKKTLASINATLEGLQPGSPFNNQLNTDLKKFESLMDQLTPLLNTLNDKSNALIFAAPTKADPQPKAKGN
ncbi:intermembrane transport protein PqiB [Orbus wheelerorum]|uniref:intermembrane transport protein PqiB n=1 Tax=Orbus wheelerorum TaxID=3074111 RepID=UPI00370D6C5B